MDQIGRSMGQHMTLSDNTYLTIKLYYNDDLLIGMFARDFGTCYTKRVSGSRSKWLM